MNIPRTLISILFVLSFLILGGCETETSALNRNSSEQNGFSQVTDSLLPAQSTSVVELRDGDTFTLDAQLVQKEISGKTIKMLAYNGQIPGPTLQVEQGSTITLNLINHTDVNTSLHSHGIRLDSAFDGAFQEEIKPGEQFTYTLKFPDAGVYWYHPHVREDYAQELGLYGNYIVKPLQKDYWSSVNQEIPIFIDDFLLGEGFDQNVVTHALMGRFGNIMLVNGETAPSLNFKKGEVIRFAFTNAANTRVFKLSIPGVKLKRVGGDGGPYEQETFVDSVILAPSERVLIEAYFEQPGDFTLLHTTPSATYPLATLGVSQEAVSENFSTQFQTLRTNTHIADAIPHLNDQLSRSPDKFLSLSINMMGMEMGDSGHMGHMMSSGAENGEVLSKIEWEDSNDMMNERSNNSLITWKIVDEQTGDENEGIDWNFKQGEWIKVRILNDPNSGHPMQHPIHFHGQRFIVLSENGISNKNLAWKDTTLIQTGDTVDILIEMSNPGQWMAHCHIAEHLHSDMMFSFGVE